MMIRADNNYAYSLSCRVSLLSPLPEVSPEGSPADAGGDLTAGALPTPTRATAATARPPLHPEGGAGIPPRRLPPGFSSLGGILSEIETGSPRGDPPSQLPMDNPLPLSSASQLDTEPTLMSLAIPSPPEGGSQEGNEDESPHSPMSGTSSGAATMIIHASPAGRFRSRPGTMGGCAIPLSKGTATR